jgi:hypothetical protein
MNATDAADFFARLAQSSPREQTLVIAVQPQGEVGALPTVPVDHIQQGFDWEAGRVILVPARPLTQLAACDVQAICESVRKGGSWHAYREYSALKARYEAQIRTLQGRLAGLEDSWQTRASDRAKNA